MESGDEAAAISLAAAGCTVAKADDVGAMLAKASVESEPLGVMGERNETRFAVLIVTHEDGELAARHQRTSAIFNEELVAFKESIERGRSR